MSGSSPSRSPITRTLTPSRCSVARSLRMKRLSRPNRSPISVAGRDQFSELKEKIVRYRMPSSLAARTTRRKASTPRRWPSARGRPRAAAQRPFPSMMIATCKGPSVRSGPSVAGAAAFDIHQSLDLDGEDFLFLGRKQLIYLRNRPVGRLLHIIGQPFLVVLGNLAVFLKFLDGIEAVAADMPDCDLGRFGVFMRHLHQFLAAFFIEFRDSQAKHLPFRGGTQAEVGVDDRLLHRLDHRLVPYLHGKQARLRHADGGELVKRHMRAVGVDLHRLQHRGRSAAGSQTAQFMLERLGGTLHAALQFVDVEITRGHNALPPQNSWSGPAHRRFACQPATMVPWPVPLRIAPIEPGSAIENTMIGSDVSRASANAVTSMTL